MNTAGLGPKIHVVKGGPEHVIAHVRGAVGVQTVSQAVRQEVLQPVPRGDAVVIIEHVPAQKEQNHGVGKVSRA